MKKMLLAATILALSAAARADDAEFAKQLEDILLKPEAGSCEEKTDNEYMLTLLEYRAAPLRQRMELRPKLEKAQERYVRCQLDALKAGLRVTDEDVKEMKRIKTSIDEAARLETKFKKETGADVSRLLSRPELAKSLSKRTRQEIIDYLRRTGHPQKDRLLQALGAEPSK